MPFLNLSCPLVYTRIRREFLYDLESHHGEVEDCVWIGINSIPGRALGFTVLTRRGAQFTRLPIHAFCDHEGAPRIPLGSLELWDCFSAYPSIVQYQYLKDKPVRTYLRSHGWERGTYLFTVDWCAGDQPADLGDSEDPEHKSAHVIRLENGCFAAQPNNRCIWLDPAYVDQPLAEDEVRSIGYRTQSRRWSVEKDWHVEPTEYYFYGTSSAGK